VDVFLNQVVWISRIEGRRKKTMVVLHVRRRLIGVTFLLCLALIGTILSAVNTIRAYNQFEQYHQRVMAGDVSTISPWMTLHSIAHVYHVPEVCLDESLHVSNPALQKHATLFVLASSARKPVDDLIYATQQWILRYRKNPDICDSPVDMIKPENFWSFPLSIRERGAL
jgi:hypothetical protein